MVDCAADVLWPHDDADHNSRSGDMVDIHIVAKAKLQENGQCCFVSSVDFVVYFSGQLVLWYNSDNASSFLTVSLVHRVK